jgi:hypothetical protein
MNYKITDISIFNTLKIQMKELPKKALKKVFLELIVWIA